MVQSVVVAGVLKLPGAVISGGRGRNGGVMADPCCIRADAADIEAALLQRRRDKVLRTGFVVAQGFEAHQLFRKQKLIVEKPIDGGADVMGGPWGKGRCELRSSLIAAPSISSLSRGQRSQHRPSP